MKLTLDLNPNHIEFIQYKIDDEHSLKFTFDTESSNDTPTIEIVASTSKIKLEEGKKAQTTAKIKKQFQDILKKADSFAEKEKSFANNILTPECHELIQKTKIVRENTEAAIQDLKDTDIDHKDERILELERRLMEYEFAKCNTKKECDYLLDKYAFTNLHYESKEKYEQKMEQLYQECEDAILNKKIDNIPFDITPKEQPKLEKVFKQFKTIKGERYQWVNPDSTNAKDFVDKNIPIVNSNELKSSKRFEDVVAEKYKNLDNEYYNSK